MGGSLRRGPGQPSVRMSSSCALRIGASLLASSSAAVRTNGSRRTLPAFYQHHRLYSKLNEPGGGWKQTLKSNGPIAFMVTVVVLGHVAWRKFQDTDALQGRGVEYPHYKAPEALRYLKTRFFGGGKSED